jgi:hypothetical protein
MISEHKNGWIIFIFFGPNERFTQSPRLVQNKFVFILNVAQGCQMVCFQTKNPKFGSILEGLWMVNAGLFYDHLEYFKVIWYNLWPFGTVCGHLLYYSQFGMFEPRKIWQPWCSMTKKTQEGNWAFWIRRVLRVHLFVSDPKRRFNTKSLSELLKSNVTWRKYRKREEAKLKKRPLSCSG